MVKEKSFQIHTVNKFTSNTEELFNKFTGNLESHEITQIRGNANMARGNPNMARGNPNMTIRSKTFHIIEIGPRDNLSTIFEVSKKKVKIDFKIQNDILSVNLTGSGTMIKAYKNMLSPYIIKSLNQAIRDLS